jgi:Ca2+-binding RTX toxin-like protein
MAVIKNVLGVNGNDTLRNTADIEVIDGGLGVDKLVFDEGTRGVSVNLKAGTITDAFGNKDTVANVEIVIGTTLADKITGSDFGDFLVGGEGNDSLYGGAGQDELYGADGNDYLSGGSGSDFFVGGQGDDTLNGGSGFDMADYSDEGGGGIVANLVTNVIFDPYGHTDTLSSIERVRGTDFADSMTGNNSANMFEGGGGNDVLDGAGGNDIIRGGFGNDTLIGGSGADMLTGGRGSDLMDGGSGSLDTADYSADGGWRGISVDLKTTMVEDSWGDTDVLVSIERVIGTDLGDWFMGSTGANQLNGMGGNDTMAGGGGNDTFVFWVGHGDDQINDFNTGDILDLAALGFTSIADVQAAAVGHNLGVQINTGAGSSILLVDVNISSLSSLNYLFA